MLLVSGRRQAGRLHADLVPSFGEDKISWLLLIEPGRDFRQALDEQVASCGVLLAIIGSDWLAVRDKTGRRRLEDPMDFVRLETTSARKRELPVIPILVRGGILPQAEQRLPGLSAKSVLEDLEQSPRGQRGSGGG